MAPSIRVSRGLHARLTALKQRTHAKTFEDVLRQLLERPRRAPEERFGAHPEMSRASTGTNPMSPETRFDQALDSVAWVWHFLDAGVSTSSGDLRPCLRRNVRCPRGPDRGFLGELGPSAS